MIRDVPLSVLVTFPPPNYTNPQTWGISNLVVIIILLAISIPTVGLRIYTRHFIKRRLGWDDFFCVVGLVLTVAYGIALCVNCYVYYVGHHIYDVPPWVMTGALKSAMAAKSLFTFAGVAIRQSLLCFYLRLLEGADIRWFKWLVYASIFVNTVGGNLLGFMCIFQCSPISAYWRYPSSAFGQCIDEAAVTFAGGVIIAILDFITVLLPVLIILQLNMTGRAKLGVICLVSMGLLASTAATARIYFIWKALIDSYDVYWYCYPLWLSAIIELNVALVCCCLPAINPWIREHMNWASDALRWLSGFTTPCNSMVRSQHTKSAHARVHPEGQIDPSSGRERASFSERMGKADPTFSNVVTGSTSSQSEEEKGYGNKSYIEDIEAASQEKFAELCHTQSTGCQSGSAGGTDDSFRI